MKFKNCFYWSMNYFHVIVDTFIHRMTHGIQENCCPTNDQNQTYIYHRLIKLNYKVKSPLKIRCEFISYTFQRIVRCQLSFNWQINLTRKSLKISKGYLTGFEISVAHSSFASKFQCGPLKISSQSSNWRMKITKNKIV